MTTEELLQWADDLVFAKTEKHLDSVEMAILEGTWQGLKYEEIAKNCNRSKSHIKNIGAELWKTLSDVLEEDIKQSNVRSVLERRAISNVYNYGDSSQIVTSNINSHINICPESSKYSEETRQRSQSPPETSPTQNYSTITNLIEAPTLTEFYDRTSELSTLKQWILEEHTRLITIYGLSGIGKSSLTLELIEEINREFDYIIWKSLSNHLTLSKLETELKEFFYQSQQTPLSTILDCFRTSRCLVILDDVQEIFKIGELAGQYLPEYQDYSKFFKKVTTSSHQSCLILLSWTKPREIVTLEAENQPLKTLNLQGLGEAATEILRQKGLKDEEKWSELITLYQGHPSWLKIIAATIQEIYNGSVSLFLADQQDFYFGDLEPIFESHLERLSKSEKQVIQGLVNQDQPVYFYENNLDLELSKSEFLQVIQSLIRRSLVEKVEIGERSLFTLNPIFKSYIKQK
jgi:predicted transcriptional regulator